MKHVKLERARDCLSENWGGGRAGTVSVFTFDLSGYFLQELWSFGSYGLGRIGPH